MRVYFAGISQIRMCPAGRELKTGTGVEVVVSLLISIFFLPRSADRADFLIKADYYYHTKVSYSMIYA